MTFDDLTRKHTNTWVYNTQGGTAGEQSRVTRGGVTGNYRG